jgi:hypothetical protein
VIRFIVDLIAHARLRNSIGGLCHRSLVAFRAVRDLLLCAKDLLVGAIAEGEATPLGAVRSAAQAR